MSTLLITKLYGSSIPKKVQVPFRISLAALDTIQDCERIKNLRRLDLAETNTAESANTICNNNSTANTL